MGKNIIITAYTLKSIIATASSSLSKFNKIRCGPRDFSDPRLQLVVDILSLIERAFKDVADRNRIENFLLYHLSEKSKIFRFGLTEYYQRKLDTDIRSFNRRMRKGGYWIE
jgi:hypothetical protein